MEKAVPSFCHPFGILQPFYANSSLQKYRFHILDWGVSVSPTQVECTSFFPSLRLTLNLDRCAAKLTFSNEQSDCCMPCWVFCSRRSVSLLRRESLWEESGQPKGLLSWQVPGTGAWFGHSAVTSFHLLHFYCLNFSLTNIIVKKFFVLILVFTWHYQPFHFLLFLVSSFKKALLCFSILFPRMGGNVRM